ncbi:MAG: hypothetical protein KC583_17735, partial [Myxococcales bacterium]|nr:hypothetical protein [Myxococcales bacterium]
ADVAAAVRRDLTWAVSFTPLQAGTADAEGELWDDGRVLVVARPFATRLTERGLVASYPDLASSTPGRDNGRSAVIEAAGDELRLLLVPHLAPRGVHIDQLDGGPFAPAHAALTAALIVERAEPEHAQALRERAVKLVEQAVSCAWADLDADGQVDPGEEGQRSTISLRATRLSDLFPSTHPRPTSPRWHRGRSH